MSCHLYLAFFVTGGAIKIVEQREKLLANMMAPKQLELKVGSQGAFPRPSFQMYLSDS
jgi:hypothetical protein